MNSARPYACPIFVFIFVVSCATCGQAQESLTPLFVIKSPKVKKSTYGDDFGTATTRISFQKQQDSDSESDKTDSDLLNEEEDELDDEFLDDLDDDLISIPETEWNLKPISSISPRIRTVSGKVPEDRSSRLTNLATSPIVSSSKVFAWAAPNINYEPLFFEDVALERYGQTRGLFRQPFASATEYLKSAITLPYTSLYDPIDSCDHPLGYARPGDCTECVKQKHFFGNPFRSPRNQ